jgi:uncharacterized protein YdaU (DUF1376 family)
MPLYVRDYLGDTSHLSTVEHGAYLLLIMHYWLNGGVPADAAKQARIARLSLREWSAIRNTVADFFDADWRHKRIDAELAKAADKYHRRASAGRQGGVASGIARQKLSKAQAMLPHRGSDAEALLNQPQPQPHSDKEKEQGSAVAPPAPSSAEDVFWSRIDALGADGISRSRCMQLLKLTGKDFVEANRILDAAAKAKRPGDYLGGTIRRLETNVPTAPAGANSSVPAWVNERRAGGVVVEAAGSNRWRSLGETLNDAGEVIGF